LANQAHKDGETETVPFEEVGLNLAMLQHTVEAVERSSNRLRKVVLIEGAKYYGAHRRGVPPAGNGSGPGR
jgi:hypothetical protein